jgi:CHAT domain-containing protein
MPNSHDLAKKVQSLTQPATLELPARCRVLGAELYTLLLGVDDKTFGPLAKRIQGKDLVIVAGEALAGLPFELLYEKDGPDDEGHYLIEKHRIRYAPSLTALHLLKQWSDKREVQPDKPLWAVGDPIYQPNDPRIGGKGELGPASRDALTEYVSRMNRGVHDGDAFLRLQASGPEVTKIRALFKADKDAVLTDLLASEAAVKTASEKGILAKARYLHFATHGILGLDKGRQPALVLNLVGNDEKEQGGGINDGFLQLDEVTNLKLNADLVVLSACATGKGRLHNGEGVTGLARAFLYAGSRGVVCSLWAVDDAATADFMVDMYRHLKDGDAAADALRAAKLKMIQDGLAPYYWAPFILIGDKGGK